MINRTRSRLASATLLAGVGVLISLNAARGAVFDQFDPNRHARLLGNDVVSNGQLQQLSTNPDFFIEESRLTGVGLNHVTLITRQHYVTATHAAPTSAIFRGADGVIRQYATSGSVQLTRGGVGTDVTVFTLSEPIPDSHGVDALPIFVGFGSQVIGQEVLVRGAFNRFGRNVVDDVVVARFNNTPAGLPTEVVQWSYDSTENGGPGGLGPDEIGLNGGDSGGSVLIEMNGEFALIGANFGVIIPNAVTPSESSAPYQNFASLLSPLIDDIDEVTLQQGMLARRLTVTAVPEPGSLAFLGLIGSGLVWRSTRLRRQKKSLRHH